MTNNILIAIALESECGGRFAQENVVYTGLGKVNAAYNLTKAIIERSPDIVINLGSAGSTKFNSQTIVNCTKFIQRDMDTTPLGFDKWVTPFETNNDAILSYGQKLPHLIEGICGSGDSFDISQSKEIYNVVDMEAYALAKICKNENISFICLKYISDGADGNAAEDWSKSLKKASNDLFNEYLNIQKLLAA